MAVYSMKESSFDQFYIDSDPENQEGVVVLRELAGNLMESGGQKMENEIEKNERQIEVCMTLNDITNEILEQYGQLPFELPINNIHIFQKLNVAESGIGGASFPEMQAVLVDTGDHSIINFARNLCHELIHLKSHGAMKYSSADGKIDHEYRHGFILRDKEGEEHYFRVLEEALTELLTKKIIERLKTKGFFADETTRMQDILEQYKVRTDYPHYDKLYSDNLLVVRDVVPEDGLPPDKEIKGHQYAYEEYRELFAVLVDKLFVQSNGRFADRQAIIDIFIRAKLEGSMLAAGRLVDEVFGVGTFRKIWELSTRKTDPELKAYIEGL